MTEPVTAHVIHGPLNWRSKRNIDWIEEHFVIPDGEQIGTHVKLWPFQVAETEKIYDNVAITRTAIISMGRKNGKTTFTSWLLLLHLVGPEAEPNSQLYSTALSREQASIIFDQALKTVRLSPTLGDYVVARETRKELYVPELGTRFRSLSSDAKSLYGLKPKFIVHDELGECVGSKHPVYTALETATGATTNPLSIIISTQAASGNDLLSLLIDKQLLIKDPRTVLSLHCAASDADPFDIESIKAANPGFEHFQSKDEVLRHAESVRHSPSEFNDYLRYYLNRRVSVKAPFITEEKWGENGAEPSDIAGMTVYGGLDLSEVEDLTALVLVYRDKDRKDAIYNVRPFFWVPEEGLDRKAQADQADYLTWQRQGLLEVVPGSTIDYEFIAAKIKDLIEQGVIFDKVAFDRFNFKHFRAAMLRADFSEEWVDKTFIPFGQGYGSMSPAVNALSKLILNNRLKHGNHPVLGWNMSNVVVERDAARNRKLVKGKDSGRIDGAIALTMAAGILQDFEALPDQNKSYLETEDLIIL